MAEGEGVGVWIKGKTTPFPHSERLRVWLANLLICVDCRGSQVDYRLMPPPPPLLPK